MLGLPVSGQRQGSAWGSSQPVEAETASQSIGGSSVVRVMVICTNSSQFLFRDVLGKEISKPFVASFVQLAFAVLSRPRTGIAGLLQQN